MKWRVGAALVAGVLVHGNAWAAPESAVGSEVVEPDAPEPQPAGSLAGIVVKVQPSIEDTVPKSWVENRARLVVRELPEPIQNGDVVRVVVGGALFEFRVSVILVRQGLALPPELQPDPIECACGTDEMLEVAAAAIEAGAWALSEEASRERKEAARAAAVVAADAPEPEPVAAPAPERYQPATLGRVGIGLLGAGGAVALAGGIVVGWRQSPSSLPANRVYLEANPRPPGYAVLGSGLALMLTGATMLVVDRVRCHRDRARCATPTAATRPRSRWASRWGGGAP